MWIDSLTIIYCREIRRDFSSSITPPRSKQQVCGLGSIVGGGNHPHLFKGLQFLLGSQIGFYYFLTKNKKKVMVTEVTNEKAFISQELWLLAVPYGKGHFYPDIHCLWLTVSISVFSVQF